MTHPQDATAPPAGFAPRPQPPYYAVIFTSQREPADAAGYGAAAQAMVDLAARQPGYLGVESARGADGLGITVSYWRSLADIAAWRAQAEHAAVRQRGRDGWYRHYELRIACVERAYGWDAAEGDADPMQRSAAGMADAAPGQSVPSGGAA